MINRPAREIELPSFTCYGHRIFILASGKLYTQSCAEFPLQLQNVRYSDISIRDLKSRRARKNLCR